MNPFFNNNPALKTASSIYALIFIGSTFVGGIYGAKAAIEETPLSDASKAIGTTVTGAIGFIEGMMLGGFIGLVAPIMFLPIAAIDAVTDRKK